MKNKLYKTYFYNYYDTIDNAIRHNKDLKDINKSECLNTLNLMVAEYIKALEKIEYLENKQNNNF